MTREGANVGPNRRVVEALVFAAGREDPLRPGVALAVEDGSGAESEALESAMDPAVKHSGTGEEGEDSEVIGHLGSWEGVVQMDKISTATQKRLFSFFLMYRRCAVALMQALQHLAPL